MRSWKHIAACPVCRVPLPRCPGHSERAWARLTAKRTLGAEPDPPKDQWVQDVHFHGSF
jgi:hypothetical protein